MDFSLSSSYFAGYQLSPEAMAAETRALGFAQVELGYFTRETCLPSWQRALSQEGLSVSSIHAFCPVPVEMPQLGPEVFSLATPNRDEQMAAIRAMRRTLHCAEEVNARAVVVHGGRVILRRPGFLFGGRPYRSQLEQVFLQNNGVADHALAKEEHRLRMAEAGRWLDAVSFALDSLLPAFETAGIILAFENLPGVEAFPDPAEMAFLRQRFPTSALGAWYDIGHGERKARVGDWPVEETLAQTLDLTVGVHLHDVRGLDEDHRAPGEGSVNFTALKTLLTRPKLIRVFEPAPQVSRSALRQGVEIIRRCLDEA